MTQQSERPNATPEMRQRGGTARHFFGFALVASFCITVMPAPRAEATDVTFGGGYVGYSHTGDTAILTAEFIVNNSQPTSGSLRMELWALATPYSGGSITGHKLAEYSLDEPLGGGLEYEGVNSGMIPFTPPPDGTWYFVMFLTELTGAAVDDGYSADDWVNFPIPVVSQTRDHPRVVWPRRPRPVSRRF